MERETRHKEEESISEQLKILRRQMKSLQVSPRSESLDYEDLCIHPDVDMPAGYKPPKFDIFDGTGDPHVHLRAYCDKWVRVGRNEKLRMKLFIISLTGEALTWYTRKDPRNWRTWQDMAEDLMDHFLFNTEITPDRFALVAKAQPPQDDSELTKYFIRAHEGIYFEKMMGMMGQKFHELVKMGDFLEEGIKYSKVQSMAALQVASKAIQSGSISSRKKKKEEGTIVTIENAEAARIPPQKAPIIMIKLRPIVIVQTYSQQPVVATRDKEDREYQTVPWTYQQKRKAKMTDSAVAHGMTRSGRCYTPEYVNRGNPGREKIQRRNITDPEAAEFWKRMSSKEYFVEEQLKKTPTHICIMDILMSSDSHKDVLLKVLSGLSVPSNTTSEALAASNGKMVEANMITFRRDELLVEGSSHNKALHITVKCIDKVVSQVLVDGGSGLHICPLSTLQELGIHFREVKKIHVRVRAFDGSQKDVIGEIYLALQIGPVNFSVLFQVMDISSSYNLLLGRPWIHMAGAVPSTLQQCIKLEWVCQEIVLHGKWGHSAYLEYDVPFIEGLDEVTFHAVEIMQTTEMEKT
nr:uncharacterized protein LOC104098741 [Nicotiana tomentosiformis]